MRLAGQTDDVDEAVSLTPNELALAVATARIARASLGDGQKTCQLAEAGNRDLSRRGLYAGRTIRAGERIETHDIVALRPSNELSPSRWRDLAGQCLTRDLAAGEPFCASDLPLSRFGEGLRHAS